MSTPKHKGHSDNEGDPPDHWNIMIDALKKYKRQHRDTNVPPTYPPNQALAEWVSRQRIDYDQWKRRVVEGEGEAVASLGLKLTEDRIMELWDLNFDFSIRQHDLTAVVAEVAPDAFESDDEEGVGGGESSYVGDVEEEEVEDQDYVEGENERDVDPVAQPAREEHPTQEEETATTNHTMEEAGQSKRPAVAVSGSSAAATSPSPKPQFKKISRPILRKKPDGTTFSQDERWLDKYEDLLRYKREHGDTLVPKKWKPNAALGGWVQNQRQHYKFYQLGEKTQMTEERINLLNEAGFDWKPPRNGRKDKDWFEFYDALKQYKEEHGDTLVNRSDAAYHRLGNWVLQQRQGYIRMQKGEYSPMTEERVQLLNEIGFIWNPGQVYRLEKSWMARYEQLKRYRDEHGNCRVPGDYAEVTGLAQFVTSQRTQYKFLQRGEKTLLTPERIDLLNEIGFEFSIFPFRRRKTWEERFEQLCQFKEENGHVEVPKRYSKVLLLPKWVREQREQVQNLFEEGKKSTLTWEQFRKLDRLGFRFTTEEDFSTGVFTRGRDTKKRKRETQHGESEPHRL